MSLPLKGLLHQGNPRTLLASFLYFDTSFMVWVLLGALGNFVASELGLSGAQKGLMTALPVLSGALLRLPVGIAADRFGGRRVGLIGLSLTTLPLLFGWLVADRIETVYLVGLFLGVAGSSFAVALPLASRWYPPEQQGLALGIAGAGNSGTVLASIFAPRLAQWFGWHAVFGLALIPILVVLVLFFVLAKDSPSRAAVPKLRDYFSVLRQSDTIWFCLFYSVTFGGFVGLASYLAIFFHDAYGIGLVAAGDLTAICVFAGSFARPVGGFLADRFGGIRVLLVLFASVAWGMFFVSRLPALALGVSVLFTAMAALGMGNGAVFQLVPQRFRQEIGILTGLVGAAGGFGGFLLPFLLGSLQQWTGSAGAGFAVYGAAATLTFLVLLAVQKRWLLSWAPHGSIARHGKTAPRATSTFELEGTQS